MIELHQQDVVVKQCLISLPSTNDLERCVTMTAVSSPLFKRPKHVSEPCPPSGIVTKARAKPRDSSPRLSLTRNLKSGFLAGACRPRPRQSH
jgi:hypothetical protein